MCDLISTVCSQLVLGVWGCCCLFCDFNLIFSCQTILHVQTVHIRSIHVKCLLLCSVGDREFREFRISLYATGILRLKK